MYMKTQITITAIRNPQSPTNRPVICTCYSFAFRFGTAADVPTFHAMYVRVDSKSKVQSAVVGCAVRLRLFSAWHATGKEHTLAQPAQGCEDARASYTVRFSASVLQDGLKLFEEHVISAREVRADRVRK